MPSLGSFFKRMIKGEPVFQSEDGDTSTPSTPELTSSDVPQAMVVREECFLEGTDMRCTGEIQNMSKQTIFLDEITIFGVKQELQRELKPGERREFIIYNGRAIQGDYINDCYLLYRDETGDYFRSNHDVDCEEESDGTQRLTRIRFTPPVKDV